MRTSLLLFCLVLCGLLKAQDPALNMNLLSHWGPDSFPAVSGVAFNDVWGYVDCAGREYAIVGSAASVHFFNVSEPDNLVEIAGFEGGANTVWRDMKTYRDRAYAVSDQTAEGLMIFDLSQLPATVIKTYHSTEFFNSAHNIYIEEATGRLYVVGSNSNDLLILDIASDPDNPMLLGSLSLPGGGYIHDIYVKDNIAYASHGYNGFYVWDVSNPKAAQLIAFVDTGAYNHSSWVSADGRYAIYAEEVPIGEPLGIIDLANMANGDIEVINTFKFPLLAGAQNNRPHNPFIRGQYAIVSYYHDGVQIFDISDPLNPSQVAYYDTHETSVYSGYEGVWGVYPFLPSGIILGTDVARGLFVLEVENINLAEVTADIYPDIQLEVMGEEAICEGSTAVLFVEDVATDYVWFRNGEEIAGNLASLEVSEAGDYQVLASNGRCETLTQARSIVVNEVPDVSDIEFANISLCEGSAVSVMIPDNFEEYIWVQNGDTLDSDGPIVAIENGGQTSLTVGINGCYAIAAVFEVELMPVVAANITLAGGDMPCAGEPAVLNTDEGAGGYTWYYNGTALNEVNAQLQVFQNGTYIVEVDNGSCSVVFDTFDLEFIIPIQPSITQDNNQLTSSEAVSYQWYLGPMAISNATQQNYTVVEDGSYSVETIDANACSSRSEELQVSLASLVYTADNGRVQLFPNPVSQTLFLEVEKMGQGPVYFEAFDVQGKAVALQFPSLQAGVNAIDIHTLSTGLYLGRFVSAGQVYGFSFVKL